MNAPDYAAASLAGELHVLEAPEQVADAAARWLQGVCATAVATQGTFSVGLSGGSTPRLLHERLREEPMLGHIDWPAWRVYFGDERAVAPVDERSNYHVARVTLLEHVPIAPDHVYRMPAERADLDAAAQDYSDLLEETLPAASTGAPRLDCLLLGLGENGHTASLFPGTPAVDVTDRWATRGRADYEPFDRITITFPTINAAANVAFLVTGASKGGALRATAAGHTPAARVRPAAGSLHWFLDAGAAAAAAGA